MIDAPPPNRRAISFAQAEGAEPLPQQLSLREISPAISARLWMVIHGSIESSFLLSNYLPTRVGEPWRTILFFWHVFVEHQMADEFNDQSIALLSRFKKIVTSDNYVTVLNFIEHVIRSEECPSNLSEYINTVLESCSAAYRIVDQTVVPISSEFEADSVKRAFLDLETSGFEGAKIHLRDAAACLTKCEFADSIRNSIHAVEAVARKLEPSAQTLGPALAALEKRNVIHSALKEGFGKLYGFTSDQKGIRHALIDDAQANVDEADAMYMFGACASFVSYLIRKSLQP